MITEKQSKLDRIIFAGIIGLLIFAPLAFGSVHVWAYTLMELGVFLLLILWIADRCIFSKSGTLSWVKAPVNLFLILLLFFIGLQIVPLPSAWTAFLSPNTYADKIQLYELMTRVDSSVIHWFTPANFQHPVVIDGLMLLTYVGTFFLVLNTVRSKKRINMIIYVLIAMGLSEVLYGIYQVFSETQKVWWWIYPGRSAGRATGTYIVPNHFAGYLELVLPLIFGFMIAQRRRHKRILSGFGGIRTSIQRWISLFAPESANPKMIFLFFSAIVLGLGLLMSGSRGGIISMGGAMLGISILFFSKSQYRKFGVLAVVFCLLAFSYGLHVGIDKTLDRFGHMENLDERLYITKTVVPMVKAYPLTGVGWGNFKYVYPRYTPDQINRVSSSGHAHNDWIEAFAELGVIGGGLILAAFIAYLVKMVRIWRNRHDLYALGIGAGVMAGLLSIGFHSYFDLNMHIPANPLTLAVLLAIGYAAIHIQGRGIKESFFYRVRDIKLTGIRRIVIFLIGFAGFIGCSYIAVSHFRAEAHCPTEWNSTLNLNWNPEYPEIRKAIEINPYNADYYYKLAHYYFGTMTKYSEAKLTDLTLNRQFNEWAIAALEKAVRLNPAKEHYWYDLGKRYSLKSYDPYGYVNKWLPLAEDCFEQAVKCAPKDANILFNVAWYWVWRSGLFSPKNGADASGRENGHLTQKEGIKNFQALFKRALILNPRRWQQAVERVWEYYPDDAVVLGIIPDESRELKSRVLKMVVMKKK